MLEIIEWICFNGINHHLAGFVDNNSVLIVPVAVALYAWLKHRASLTPDEWDDNLITRIGRRFGLEKDDE